MPVLSAVIGVIGALGGVIVGAVLSARRDRHADQRSARVARHLVEIELEEKLFALEALANRGRLYTPGLQDLSRQDSWDKHAEELAAFDDEPWDTISQAFSLSRSLVIKVSTMDESAFSDQVERLRKIVLAALQELRPGYVDPFPSRIPGAPPVAATLPRR
jgi:hypothetical protein